MSVDERFEEELENIKFNLSNRIAPIVAEAFPDSVLKSLCSAAVARVLGSVSVYDEHVRKAVQARVQERVTELLTTEYAGKIDVIAHKMATEAMEKLRR